MKETILRVGTEGGAITLSRVKEGTDCWLFFREEGKSTLAALLDNSADVSDCDLSNAVSSFEEAMLLMDVDPWHRMVALEVHPDFLDAVLERLEKRLADEGENGSDDATVMLERWKSFLALCEEMNAES